MTTLPNLDVVLTEMEAQLRPHLKHDPIMIGVHTGGLWIAQHLHKTLALTDPLGELDISFYRDDFTHIGLHPKVKASHLPVDLNERHIILVDDVLYTGRTTRAAMNVIFDYGRPSSIILAVLIDRDGRELPVQPDVAGQHISLTPQQHIKLTKSEVGILELRIETMDKVG